MSQALECIRCHTLVVDAYVPDFTESRIRQQVWHPGEPEPSFWVGLKMKKDLRIPVRTARCPNCGYLESYAIRQLS
jgi:hypothetical protein